MRNEECGKILSPAAGRGGMVGQGVALVPWEAVMLAVTPSSSEHLGNLPQKSEALTSTGVAARSPRWGLLLASCRAPRWPLLRLYLRVLLRPPLPDPMRSSMAARMVAGRVCPKRTGPGVVLKIFIDNPKRTIDMGTTQKEPRTADHVHSRLSPRLD